MLTKIITDVYGNSASYFELETGNVNPDPETGDISAPEYQLRVYKDYQAKLDGYRYVDCLRPTLDMSITEVERDAETGENDVEKQIKAFLRKATISTLDENGRERNIFNGLKKDVSFVGCEV